MNMRKWIVNTIKNIPEITALIPPERIISSGAIGVTGQPQMQPPLIVIRGQILTPAPFPSAARQQRFLVWVHDKPGTWTLIEEVLEILREKLPTRAQVHSGEFVCVATWESDGDDFADDGLGTSTRYGSYLLTSRE